MNGTSKIVTNPYVGPRTFTQAQQNLFFGREREARDLTARVLSERLVLFYAQSGAGKSSLLNTRLIPDLREVGYAVLPVVRVGGELPVGVGEVSNIYTFNLMTSVDASSDDSSRFTQLTLPQFLAGLVSDDGEHFHYHANGAAPATQPAGDAASNIPCVLIIDQFEEIITNHPAHWQSRDEFFRQINEAMLADPNLWVVLTLREDYVAALEPYAPLMVDHLRARFYMERMGIGAALEAIKKPAAAAGHPFAEGVAEMLVDNLRRIRAAQADGEQLGQYIEPVQLQVACYQLWQNLTTKDAAGAPAQITLDDLDEFGDVDRALANFYEGAIQQVLQEEHVGVSELMLRNWFGRNLITEAGTRGIIFRGQLETAGIPNEVVTSLAKTFLLRSELRAGSIWYELVHDRFVTPIIQSNQAWIRHQPLLVQVVQRWLDAERDPSLLLRGRLLKEAQRETASAPPDMLVGEFLAASAAAAEAEQRHFWSPSETSAHQLPEFDRSFAVVIQIPDKFNPTPADAPSNRTIAEFTAVLQTEHGYFTHQQREEVSRHWLIDLFTEILPREVSERDRLLVYIAGPGLSRKVSDTENEFFLVPEDGSAEFLHELISLDQICIWLAALECRHWLIVFDGVFAEPLPLAQSHHPEKTPVVAHQAQYDWYVKQFVQQLISIPAQTPTTGELPFAQTFLQQLAQDTFPANHSGIATAIEWVRNFFSVQQGADPAGSTSLHPPLVWNLSSYSWGEYLFALPGRARTLEPAPTLARDDNPYRGLEPYESRDARLFFGRNRLIQELIEKVKQNQLTVVLGASGTGKSSLVKAGLAPRLSNLTPAENNGRHWTVLSPMRPLNAPLNLLAKLLEAELTHKAPADPASTPEQLANASFNAITAWLRQHEAERLLLIVDQLEEVVTMCRQQEEREHFLKLLARLLANHPEQFHLVFTVRSDFEPHFAGSQLGQPLDPFWRQARYVVTPMNRQELREVIELPAAAHFLDFRPPELVERLIDEVEQTPGALSLLSFSLSELFLKYVERATKVQAQDAPTERALTIADYNELGGVIGSLSRRATELYERLDAQHQATMQRVMLRMIAVEGGELARRRVPRAELDYPLEAENARVDAVIDQMALAQLVSEGSDEAGVAYVEPAHDALVRAWDKLLIWKRQAEDILPLQRRLTQVADEWKRSPEADKGRLLWHNDPRLPLLQQELSPATLGQGALREFLRSMQTTLWPSTAITDKPTWLNRTETEFVQKSISKRARNLRQISGVIIVVVLLLALLAGLAQYNAQQATQARMTAEAEAERANLAEGDARTEAARANHLQSVARARQLAAFTSIELNQDRPELALLLALEARAMLTITADSDLSESQEAYSAIRASLIKVPGGPPILYDAEGDILQVTWDEDERRALILTAVGIVYVWDTETGRSFSIRHVSMLDDDPDDDCHSFPSPIWDATWSKNQELLLTRGADGTVRIWDTEYGRQQAIFGQPVELHVRQEGTNTRNQECIYYNAETGESLNPRGDYGEDIWQATWSPDESRIVTRLADGTAQLWNADTGEQVTTFTSPNKQIWGAIWSKDGRRVLTYSTDRTARIWNARDGVDITARRLVSFTGHSDVIVQATWSQDEKRVLTRGADHTVRIWDAEKGTELVRLESEASDFVEATWSSDEQRVLTYSEAVAQIWDANTGEALVALEGHTGAIVQATWSQEEGRVLTRSKDNTVRIWDATTGSELNRFVGHTGAVLQATWNRAETHVLTTSVDGTARIWNSRTGEVRSLESHSAPVWGAEWSHDDRRVLTRGADNSVRVWDAETGREMSRLIGHFGTIRSATWSQDDQRIFTYGNDNTLGIWYTDPEELVALACQYVSVNMTLQELATYLDADETHSPPCPNARLAEDVLQVFQDKIKTLLQKDELTASLAQARDLDHRLPASQSHASMTPAVISAFEAKIRALVRANHLAEALALAHELDEVRQGASGNNGAALSAEQAVAQVLFSLGEELARAGDVDGAIARFTQAQEFKYPGELEPERDARRIAGAEWMKRGRAIVTTLNVDVIAGAFQRAVELDPALGIEPQREARQLVAQQLIAQGSQLALRSEVEAAIAKFEQALTLVAPGTFATDANPSTKAPLVAEAQRLVQLGDIDGALVRFAAERTRAAAVQRSQQLATSSMDKLNKGQTELALLLALEAQRALPVIGSLPVADARAADNAARVVLTHAQNHAAFQPCSTCTNEIGFTRTKDDGFFQRIQLDVADLYWAWSDVWQATWSQDEQRILTRNARGLVGVWHLDTGEELHFFHNYNDFVDYGHNVWEATWSQDEQRILTRGDDGVARIWDAATGQELARFEGHTGDVWQATWSQDEQRVLTRGDDSTVRIWEAATGRPLALLKGHRGDVWEATWSQDERSVLTRSNDDTARIWDVATGKEQKRFVGHTGDIWQASWSQDERLLLTRSADATVRIWDAATGEELIRLAGHAGAVLAATWNQDESRILTFSTDGVALIWDAAAGRELVRFAGHEGAISEAIWNQDESRLLTRSEDRTGRVWDAATGEELIRLAGHAGAVLAATWNQDESRILTFSTDGTARLWDAESGSELVRFAGHAAAIVEATWNHDESRLLTRSEDRTVRIWDAVTGQELARFDGHTDNVKQATWSQDEQRVLTRSDDNTVRIWYTERDGLIAAACQQVTQNMNWADWTRYMGDASYHLTCPTAKIPEDVVQAFHDKIRLLLQGQNRTEAFAQADQLNGWLSQVGQRDSALFSAVAEIFEDEVKGLVRADKLAEAHALANELYRLRLRNGLSDLTALSAKQSLARELMTMGVESAQKGDLDGAIASFKAALVWNPALAIEPESKAKSIAAQVLLTQGYQLAKEKQLDPAIARLEAARKLDPSLAIEPEQAASEIIVQLLLEEGHELAGLGEVAAAIAKFEAALPLVKPGDAEQASEINRIVVEFLVTEGQRLAQQGDKAEAIAHFERALAYDPGLGIEPAVEADVWAQVNAGRQFLQKRAYAKAMSTLASAAAAQPTLNLTATLSAQEWNELCRGGSLQGAASIVLPACTRATALAPQNQDYLDSQAIALALTGNLPGAIKSFEAYLEQASKSDQKSETVVQREVWVQLLRAGVNPVQAYIAASLGQLDEALVIYNEIERLGLQLQLSANEWNNLCWNGILHGYVLEVLDACGQAVMLDSENANYRDSRGFARAATGDIQGALEDFNYYVSQAAAGAQVDQRKAWIQALQAGVNPVAAYLAVNNGRIDEALAIYRRLDESKTDLPLSTADWNNLCWNGSHQGRAAATLFACERAVAFAPENGDYRDSRGLARALTGDFSGAIDDFEFAIQWAEQNHQADDFIVKRHSWVLALKLLQLMSGNSCVAIEFLAKIAPDRFDRCVSQPAETAPLSEPAASFAPPIDQQLLAPPDADPLTVQLVETWNQYGGLLNQISVEYELDLATTVALFQVEGPQPGFAPDGRLVIRFENHLFFDRWGKENPEQFQPYFRFDTATPWQGHQWRPTLGSPWQLVHIDQQSEWQAFELARQLDETAAQLAISMGRFQMMGFNYGRLGYSSVQEMFNAFQTDERNHVLAFFNFIKAQPNLLGAIRTQDYVSFARGYNGPGQAEHYGELIARGVEIFTALAVQTNIVTSAEQLVEPAAVDASVPVTRSVRVGIMGRNAPNFTEADYALLQEAKIEAIVLLSTVDPDVFAEIKERNPDILIITRLTYADGRFGQVRPQQFVAMMTPVLKTLRPYSTHFQILNEPNHVAGVEGWGSEDADAEAFNLWFLEVYAGLKTAHPWARLGFPALAVPDALHRDKAWLQINQEAIQQADWLGVHTFWQTPPEGHANESVLFAACCGLNFTYYHERYPNKVLHITEFGNSNGLALTFATDESLYASEYVQWLNEVFKYPYIGSASAFIMSSPDLIWESFTWRDERGGMKAVVPAVGEMPRPEFVNSDEQ